MSNRVVPQVYRAVIDDVIKSIRADYQENGVEDDVLEYLQQRWEANLVETRVAQFDADEGNGDNRPTEQAGPPYLNGVTAGVKVETLSQEDLLRLRGGGLEDDDDRTGFSDEEDEDDFDDADEDVMGLGGGVAGFAKLSKYAKSSPPAAGEGSEAGTPAAEPLDVKPKLDGEAKPVVQPRPTAGGNGNAGGSRGVPDENGLLPGDEIIDSDLDDDSDEEEDDENKSDADEEEDRDYVLCVYDKVQRVKNKWKTTFKEGLIHVNGKDYLFSKCNGEFEW